jgi:hypothetical protein
MWLSIWNVPCVTVVAVAVWNALTGWHWAEIDWWEGFVSLVFICGISLATDHDHVYLIIVLNNEHTVMNLHHPFQFLPSLVLPCSIMHILWTVLHICYIYCAVVVGWLCKHKMFIVVLTEAQHFVYEDVWLTEGADSRTLWCGEFVVRRKWLLYCEWWCVNTCACTYTQTCSLSQNETFFQYIYVCVCVCACVHTSMRAHIYVMV